MIKPLLAFFLPALLATAAPAAAGYDLYVSAAVNKGYVIGSKIVTMNGLFRQTGQGEWQHLGHNDTSIRSVAIDPRDRRVIYLAANNGCWRSLDGGATWRITTDWTLTEPLQVTLDPGAPDHVYLAVPDGIVVSHDRGQTWHRRETGLPDRGKYTQTIQVDRTQVGRVLAGCESGIYLTDDGAMTWRRVLATDTTVDDLQQSPHDPQTWLAVTQSNGAWSSHDGGRSWQQLAGVPSRKPLYCVVFDPTHPQRVAIGGWAEGVLTSEDGGKTWVTRNAGLPDRHRVKRLAVEPGSGRLYASVTGEGLFGSEDFGRTWKHDGFESSDITSFVFLPAPAK